VQDSFSNNHAGFQGWSGGLPNIVHIWNDSYPDDWNFDHAVEATVQLINNYEKTARASALSRGLFDGKEYRHCSCYLFISSYYGLPLAPVYFMD
jgi:hypothetical protein